MARAAKTAPTAKADPRARIVDALMELAGERAWEDISISDIAARAGVSLADFRDAFPSKGAVLAGLSRRIDRIVLDDTGDELAGEPAKDRLFDVLMRRLDAMTPYRAGLEAVARWARRDPVAALALNQMAVNSMRFMLEAARIDAEGPLGLAKTQGLVLVWLRVLDVWFDDDEGDLSRTMAALDRELARGGEWARRAEKLHELAQPLRNLCAALFAPRPAARAPRRRSEDETVDV
jgi:AcrR family transcriptional regulator